MKKVLILLLMAGTGQRLFSQQQPTQYKYLNELSEDSQIRRKCESVKRAWFVKGKIESRCDALDHSYDLYRRIMHGEDVKESIYSDVVLRTYSDLSSEPETLASKDMRDQCALTIFHIIPEVSEKDKKKEHAVLMSLAYNIRAKEVEPLKLKRLLQKEERGW